MSRLPIAIAALILSSPVLAASATIATATDGVLVNQGDQFVTAQVGQQVVTGDRIMVPAGGSSTLTFDDGCSIQVQPDTLVTIPDSSPCAGGQVNTQRVTPASGASGSGAAASASGDSWVGWTYLATVVGVVVYKTNEDDDDTASP